MLQHERAPVLRQPVRGSRILRGSPERVRTEPVQHQHSLSPRRRRRRGRRGWRRRRGGSPWAGTPWTWRTNGTSGTKLPAGTFIVILQTLIPFFYLLVPSSVADPSDFFYCCFFSFWRCSCYNFCICNFTAVAVAVVVVAAVAVAVAVAVASAVVVVVVVVVFVAAVAVAVVVAAAALVVFVVVASVASAASAAVAAADILAACFYC